MENQSVFLANPTNFQFLSVCHYINIFGLYFYNNHLIKLDEKSQSVPVLNTLFDYLNNSKNETEAKYKLLKKALKGSDLYGGGKNETLDMKYVDETYHYIISTALFSHYGNINVYLAKIINTADNVNYTKFKEVVQNHLFETYITKEYCLSGNFSSRLSRLAINKIYKDHILPIFPEPETDMSILDVCYIYAMVGLKMFKSMSNNENQLTFNEYILISREFDMQEFNETSFQMGLELFSAPALFYYAFNYKKNFQEYETLNDRFWIIAYERLFQSIDSSMVKIVDEIIGDSLLFKFENQLDKIENRTQLATRLLKVSCAYDKLSDVPSSYVSTYKSLYLWTTKAFLPARCNGVLPDLEEQYNEQFTEIEKVYREIIKQSIEELLVQNNLIEKLNVDTLATSLTVPTDYTQCGRLPCDEIYTLNRNVFLVFGIYQENVLKNRDTYAIVKDETTMKVLHAHGNDTKFSLALVNKTTIKLYNHSYLKRKGHDYKIFIKNVANMKSNEFISQLKNENYVITGSQKVFYYVKMFIPFYNCVENVKAGIYDEAIMNCALDIFSLIPYVGFASKVISRITTKLEANMGKFFIVANSISRVNFVSQLALITSMKELAKVAVRTIGSEILSRGTLKSFIVASLRALDPGFELMYKLTTGGYKLFCKLLRNIHFRFKNTPALAKLSSSINLVLKQNTKNAKLIADQTGLVPMIQSKHRIYDSVRYFYPGSSNFFGPVCVKSHGKVAELRKLEGSSRRIPVIPEISDDQIFYKQYYPKLDKVDNMRLTMGDNDVLQRYDSLLKDLIFDHPNFKVTQDYQVYHNTIEWNKAPKGGNSHVNIRTGNPVDASIPGLPRINSGQVTNVEILQRINLDGIRGFTRDRNFPVVVRGGPLSDAGNVIDPNIQSTSTGLRPMNPNAVQELDNLDSVIQESSQAIEVLKSPEVTKYYHKKFDSIIPEHLKIQSVIKDVPRIAENPDAIPQLIQRPSVIKEVPLKVESPDDIPQLIQRPSVIKEVPREIEYFDDIPGTSQQAASNLRPSAYMEHLTEPIYKDYVNALLEWKDNGLCLRTENLRNVISLRTSVNKLALFQVDKIPVRQTPIKAWCIQNIRGQNNIDFLINLKGKEFFFNDMTLVSKVQPKFNEFMHLDQSLQEVEVVYHMNIDSRYGFVDLTSFHHQLQNYYVTFSDQIFLVKDTSFAENGKLLNVFLDAKPTTRELWLLNRQQDAIDLIRDYSVVKYPRLQNLEAAATYMVANVPKCSYKIAKNHLKNYVLSIQPSSKSIVPTYNIMANELRNMKYTYVYDTWRVHQDKYILDVLYEANLDTVTNVHDAFAKIVNVHGVPYYGNVESVYNNYRRLERSQNLLRFEDYYVLQYHNHFEGSLNIHARRRYETAVTRLALRQAEAEFAKTPIKLFSSGAVSKRMLEHIEGIYNNRGKIRFNSMKSFNRARKLTPVTILKEEQQLTHKSTFLEIEIDNRAGIVNLNSVLKEEKDAYVATKKFEFLITSINNKRMNGQNVMVIQLRDVPTATENRMALMAQNLHELFTTDTKFFYQ